MLLSCCGYLSLMHFSFVCRHDAVLAAAEVALHVEKEVKATGKSTMQCSKHPNQVLHAHTVAPLLLSRSDHCMQSSMQSQTSKCAFFKFSTPHLRPQLSKHVVLLPLLYKSTTCMVEASDMVAAMAGRGKRYCRHNRCMACALQQYQLRTKGSSH